jgi:hypothetical protein
MRKSGISQEDIAKRAYRVVAMALHSTHNDEILGAAERHQMRLEVRSLQSKAMHNQVLLKSGGIEARR